MTETTIVLAEPILSDLERNAADRQTSVSALIEDAVCELIERSTLPRFRSMGAGDSGFTDTARRTGDERPEPRSWR